MTRRLRPTFWATVLTTSVLVVLVLLGTWQVQRLEWKNQLIENRAARIIKPPVSVAALAGIREGWVDKAGLAALEYMSVELHGSFVGVKTLRLLPRIRDGRQGVHLIAPFDAGSPLGVVLIDRGWAPLGTPLEILRPPSGPVRVDGYLRLFEAPGPFVPANEPDTNNWFFMDEPAMMAAVDLSEGAGFYVQAGPNARPSGAYPLGSVPDVNLRNSHLEYAVTWYALAAVLVVIFVVFHWRRDET